MLARATVRGREIAIRAALGAGRWRLVRGLLVEGLVLSFAGAAIGILLAYAGVQALKAWMTANVPRVAGIAIDLRVLLAAIAAAGLTGLFFGAGAPVVAPGPDDGAQGQRALVHRRRGQDGRERDLGHDEQAAQPLRCWRCSACSAWSSPAPGLRRDGLRRRPAYQRDRRPDGARRDAAARNRDGARARLDPHRRGIVVGAGAAWSFSAGVKTFLFEMEPNDLRIFAVALATLAAAGLLASAVPARRAASVDPMIALRRE